jgi:hypothetical protein
MKLPRAMMRDATCPAREAEWQRNTMLSAIEQAPLPADPRSFVSTDMVALASHMDACKQSQGRFFSLRSSGDLLRALVSSRIVSTGAVVGVAALAVLLYFA